MPKVKTQIDKFREAAAALGADVSEPEFEAAVSKVAKAPKLTDAEIKDMARAIRANKASE